MAAYQEDVWHSPAVNADKLICWVQGKSMPERPTHSASFQGSVYRFEIQANKAQTNRFKITCHGHMYIGHVRHMIASKLQLEPENIRLFTNGISFLQYTRLKTGTHCRVDFL